MARVDPDLEAVERAMIRIRRSVTRRELGRSMAGVAGVASSELPQFFAVDAVDEASEHPGRPVTVGTVAERLGVDPSRASRLVANAVRGGYLKRVASQADGRQSLLELTDAGRDVVKAMHAHRQAQFAAIMRDWSPHERQEFARLLTRFTSDGDSGESGDRGANAGRG